MPWEPWKGGGMHRRNEGPVTSVDQKGSLCIQEAFQRKVNNASPELELRPPGHVYGGVVVLS